LKWNAVVPSQLRIDVVTAAVLVRVDDERHCRRALQVQVHGVVIQVRMVEDLLARRGVRLFPDQRPKQGEGQHAVEVVSGLAQRIERVRAVVRLALSDSLDDVPGVEVDDRRLIVQIQQA
jgi:hypothetical protein